MATLAWCPKRRILCGFQGDQAVLKFAYSVFENIERGLVTPSMYSWMVSWIQGTISTEHLDAMVQGDCDLILNYAEDAHRAYHDLPWQERLELHNQTVENLKSELRCIELDENELRDADNPFNYSSSLFDAYEVWARDQSEVLSKRAMQVADELDEEAQWEQGGEDGASQTDGPMYDHMDEV
jgi:hypothetical protein